jgi:hypothetical protein
MPASRPAAWLAGVMVPAAAVAQAAMAQGQTAPENGPPTIECTVGFEGLKTAALALPGAQASQESGFDKVTQMMPEAWRVEIFVTTRWHPAYPAVAIRTLRKQVTGVWTADSKACGYGDQAQFASLVDDMKTSDKALTDASRAEVARRKAAKSPLAVP